MLGTLGAVTAGLTALNGIIGNAISGATAQDNLKYQREANEQNIAFQRETNAKNEQLMRESWAREDNAVSRRIADLTANGLSKTLGVNGASTSGAISVTAPNMQTLSNNFHYKDVDVNALNAMSMINQIDNQFAQNELLKAQAAQVKANTAKAKQETHNLQEQFTGIMFDNMYKDTSNLLRDLELTEKGYNYASYGNTQPKGVLYNIHQTLNNLFNPYSPTHQGYWYNSGRYGKRYNPSLNDSDYYSSNPFDRVIDSIKSKYWYKK